MFQTAWLREFRLVFGGSTSATAAVLSIFMGGLGLGNAWLGRTVNRHPSPLLLYALFEGVIAVSAALSPWAIDLVRMIYIRLGGQETMGFEGATVVRMLLASLVLLVPTICMGGTLPAIAKAVTTSGDRSRRGMGFFYGVNTLGAVAGTLLGTFVMFESLGTRGALWSACAVNLLLAYAAWRMSRSSQPASIEKVLGPDPALNGDRNRTAPVSPVAVYAAALVVGFSFFLMELVWYRMLGPLLGGTTFTFGLILASALAGIGLGGALYGMLFRRHAPSLSTFAITCALEAACIAAPFAWGDGVALWKQDLMLAWGSSFTGVIATWSVVAMAVVLPAALVSGIQFPLLIALLGTGRDDIAEHVGRTCAWNTVGAIAGSLVGGFGFLPALSAPGCWQLVVVLLIGLGVAALLLEFRTHRFVVPVNAALSVVTMLAAGWFAMHVGPTAVWRHSGLGVSRAPLPRGERELTGWMHVERRVIDWEQDGREAAIALGSAQGLSLVVNGKSDGNSVRDAGTQIMLGILGPLLHEHPRRGLVVGMGTGESAGYLAESPGMERVDIVELEAAVDEMARRCRNLNFNVIEHPKVRRIYNDAREVLLTTREKYDVIVSEPSNPYRAGVAALFTAEFYKAAADRLNQRGLFVQWLQGYEISRETAIIVFATLRKEFAYVQAWQGQPGDMILICSQDPPRIDLSLLRERMGREPLRSGLVAAWGVDAVEDLLSRHAARPEFISALAETARHVNTDDLNHLEYGFVRSLGMRQESLIPGFRREAREKGWERPDYTGEIDIARLAPARYDAYFWPLSDIPGEDPYPPELESHCHTFFRYRLGQFEEMVARKPESWPRGIIEKTLLAHAYASLGDSRAAELIAELENATPTSARFLSAIGHARRADREGAKRSLLAGLTSLSRNPWTNDSIIQQGMLLGLELAQQDAAFARDFFNALAEPFAGYAYNEIRQFSRLDVSRLLEPDDQVAALMPYEK